eukprot:33327-Hanusia_phi.AAC.2
MARMARTAAGVLRYGPALDATVARSESEAASVRYYGRAGPGLSLVAAARPAASGVRQNHRAYHHGQWRLVAETLFESFSTSPIVPELPWSPCHLIVCVRRVPGYDT